MANYRRAKLAADAFRSFTSRNVPRTEPVSRVYSTKSSTLASNAAKFSSSYSIFHRSLPQRQLNPFLGFSERYYCVDRWQVQNFRQRGPRRWVDWFKSKCRVFVFTLNYSFETVPYTNRWHFVRLSPSRERKRGEARLEEIKAAYKGKFLPARHPKSMRVRLIAKNIIDALKRELRHDEGKDRGVKEATSHLVDLNWEVLVVDHPIGDAVCLPGGKNIVYFTGLLKDFGSDAEIATTIGHEVGHAVARHHAEGVLWIEILRALLFPFISPEFFNALSLFVLRQRMELEADHIGLLLMASAGYDPRVVPIVYDKMAKLEGDSAMRDPYYPSGKKRAEMLARANVMEEALTVYRNARAGSKNFSKR